MAGKTKLEAINLMLRYKGQEGVSILTSTAASKAVAVLDEVSKEIQAESWPSNTEIKATMTPDVNKHIIIASNVLQIDAAGQDAWRRFTIQGQYLYDIDENTNEFQAAVTVNIVRELDYENLSPKLKTVIALEAAVRFQSQTLTSTKMDSFINRDLRKARIEALNEKLLARDTSILNNITAQEIIGTYPGVMIR